MVIIKKSTGATLPLSLPLNPHSYQNRTPLSGLVVKVNEAQLLTDTRLLVCSKV